jgi:hypothetical protein
MTCRPSNPGLGLSGKPAQRQRRPNLQAVQPPTGKRSTLQAHKVHTSATRMARCQENPDKLRRLSRADPSPRTTLHMTYRPSKPGLGPSGKPAQKAETPGP